MSCSVPDNGSTSLPVNIVSRWLTWCDKQPYPLSKRQPMSYGWQQTICTSTSTPLLSMPSMRSCMPSGSTWNMRWQTFSPHCRPAISQYGNERILRKVSGEEETEYQVVSCARILSQCPSMNIYRATCINLRTKCQSTVVQSISSSSIAGPGVLSTQRTCPQTKLRTSSAVASSSTRGTSPLMPIIHWVTRRVASVIVCSLRDIATIHGHRMPGDKRGRIRAEPDHRFRYFFWGTDPSDGP